ncbi:MAG: zinc ribbon domain-containing protein [Myxococcota bacterium]
MTVESDPATQACASCAVTNAAHARFCKACGASLQPPASCPACQASVPADARFCQACGVRLVGARPAPAQDNLQKSPVAPLPAPEPGPSAPAPSPEVLIEKLRAERKGRSNIGANLALFVAILLVFVVVMKEWNKDKPKEGNMFGGGPPAKEMATPPTNQGAAAAPGSISGSVKLASGAKAGGTLFVIVRPAGSPERGPPLAVKRFESPSFPVSFSVGASDAMMGQPFTGPFDVSARLDRDGNAMTRGDDDVLAPAAHQVGVGTSGLELVLGGTEAPVVPAAASPTAAPASPEGAGGTPGSPVAGTIRLAPGLEPIKGALFIVFRAQGSPDKGPPIAVMKIDSPSLPAPFEVGPANVMLEGMPFSGPFDVYARIDADGNAMTREAGDLEMSAPKSGVLPGQRGVEVVIDKRR